MLELEKAFKYYEKYLKLSKRGFNKGWRDLNNAEEQYEIAAKLREGLLQNILEERGLAVCSETHFVKDHEGTENITAEQLGVYPREQMRLLYSVFGPYTFRGVYEDSFGMDRTLRLLCPKHFPKKTEWFYHRDKDLFSNIKSEVVKKEEKFILAVNGTDITELVNKGGRDIYPDGRKPFLVDQVVFRYFGIPDLPKEPDINLLQLY